MLYARRTPPKGKPPGRQGRQGFFLKEQNPGGPGGLLATLAVSEVSRWPSAPHARRTSTGISARIGQSRRWPCCRRRRLRTSENRLSKWSYREAATSRAGTSAVCSRRGGESSRRKRDRDRRRRRAAPRSSTTRPTSRRFA